MAHLDREFEIKAMKLLNVLKLPGMDEESEESLDTPDQGIGEEKLDTQQIDVYGTNEKNDFITVKAKSKVNPILPQRKILRETTRQGGTIQGKAEAAEKKQNDISGNKTSFAIFNTINPEYLTSVALASNANLGPNETEIDSNVNTIRAHEAAKAAIIAKKKVDSEKQKSRKKKRGKKIMKPKNLLLLRLMRRLKWG